MVQAVLIRRIKRVDPDTLNRPRVRQRQQILLRRLAPRGRQRNRFAHRLHRPRRLRIGPAPLEHVDQIRIILLLRPRPNLGLFIQLVVHVVEAHRLLRGHLQPPCKLYRRRTTEPPARNERVGNQRIHKRTERTIEELPPVAHDTRRLLIVEVEPNRPPVQILVRARKPQVVNAARPLFIEDHMLAVVINVKLRIRPPKPVIVAACPVITGQIIRLNAAVHIRQQRQVFVKCLPRRLGMQPARKNPNPYRNHQ